MKLKRWWEWKLTIYVYIIKDFLEDTSSQINRLISFKCQNIFIENNDLSDDTELNFLLKKVEKDDRIIAVSILSFGKNSNDIKIIIKKLINKKINLFFIKENIDVLNEYPFIDILSLSTFLNKEITSEKVKKKLSEVQKSGKKLGRPAIDDNVIKSIQYLRKNDNWTLRDISDKLGISLGTAYKYTKDMKRKNR